MHEQVLVMVLQYLLPLFFENYIDDSFDVDCIDVGIRHSDDTIVNDSGIKLLDI